MLPIGPDGTMGLLRRFLLAGVTVSCSGVSKVVGFHGVHDVCTGCEVHDVHGLCDVRMYPADAVDLFGQMSKKYH